MSEANKTLLRLKLRLGIYRNWHQYQEQRHFDTIDLLLQKEKQETNQLQQKRLNNSSTKIKSQKNGFSNSATKKSASSCNLGSNAKIANNGRSQSQTLSNSSSYSCAMDEFDNKVDIKPSLSLSSSLSSSNSAPVKSEMIEFDQFNDFQELNNEDLNFYLNDHSKDQGFIGSMDELLDTACNDQDILMDPEFLESFFDELVDQDQSYQTVKPLLSYSQISSRQQQLNSNHGFHNNQLWSQNSTLHSIHHSMPIPTQMSNSSQVSSQQSPAASKKLQQLAEQAQAKHDWTSSNVGNISKMANSAHHQIISPSNNINQTQMISQSCLMQPSTISPNQCYNNSHLNNNNNINIGSRNDGQSNYWLQQRKDVSLSSGHPKMNLIMMNHQETLCNSNLNLQSHHAQPINPLPSNQLQIHSQINPQTTNQYRQYWSQSNLSSQINHMQHDYHSSHQQVIPSHNQHYYNNFEKF